MLELRGASHYYSALYCEGFALEVRPKSLEGKGITRLPLPSLAAALGIHAVILGRAGAHPDGAAIPAEAAGSGAGAWRELKRGGQWPHESPRLKAST